MRIDYHGFLVIDKPGGMTSRDVVDRALRWFPRKTRIGHTGTLDPMATGVLALCVGSATRLADRVQRMPKTYSATILLGARSTTDDADGDIVKSDVTQIPASEEIIAGLSEFKGEIEQIPPDFSAAHVSGRRAYTLARKGQKVCLPPRRVEIYRIEVLAYAFPHLEIEVHCGKGTYIRSLARDLGERLGCGALLQTLRRTQVGPFRAASGLSLDANSETVRSSLHPLTVATADLPQINLKQEEIDRLRQGQPIPLDLDLKLGESPSEVVVLTPSGFLSVLGEIKGPPSFVTALKVFPVFE